MAFTVFNNWSNIHIRLAEHDQSKCHPTSMKLKERLLKKLLTKLNRNINQERLHCVNYSKDYWKSLNFVLERNIAFRGSAEEIGHSYNGNFLGLIEY